MDSYISRAPWSAEPSLKFKAEEVGVDFDALIEGFGSGKSDLEMAQEFDVTEKLIFHLRNSFMSRGLGSIIGQD